MKSFFPFIDSKASRSTTQKKRNWKVSIQQSGYGLEPWRVLKWCVRKVQCPRRVWTTKRTHGK